MSYLHQKSFQFWAFVGVSALAFILLFKGIMLPFVIGIVIAYLLNPVVQKMQKRGIPRWLSSMVILGAFFITLTIGLLIAVPLLAKEMVSFIRTVPDILTAGQAWLAQRFPMIEIPSSLAEVQEAAGGNLDDKMGDVLSFSRDILGNVLAGGMAVVTFLSFLVLIPIVSFYLMVDWPRIVRKTNNLVPKHNEARFKSIFKDIDATLSGFIRGQLTVCFMLGAFYAIALTLVGLQYGFFIGVAAGVLSIIPYVGSAFGLVASVGMAFYQFGWWEYPVIVLAIFAVGQLVEGNYLTPKLVGESVGLHPIWVIFVLMAGGSLLGLLGMIIAVPVAAIAAVLLGYALEDYKGSSYYRAEKIEDEKPAKKIKGK